MTKLILFQYLLLFIFSLLSIASVATTYTITNANDSGAGSLRETIAMANFGDEIKFDADYTINLSSSLVIDKDLMIDGGDKKITISGQKQYLVIKIQEGTQVNINNLAMVDGKGNRGAGISNYGKLKLEQVTFLNNKGTSV